MEVEGGLFAVVHLMIMIAGRLRWRERGVATPAQGGLAAFDFDDGTLLLTEAGKRRRVSLHLVDASAEANPAAAVRAPFDPGGLEVMDADPACTIDEFRARLAAEDHTLKRALTDPRILSGIGNAWSDEILHAARLSPLARTSRLTGDEAARLLLAIRRVLADGAALLRERVGDGFPEKVTAFEEGMAVHGRYGQPCPAEGCGAPVQRIRYADSETNYCARCQTEGRLLADRSLSRLLKDDWPRTLEELEDLRSGR